MNREEESESSKKQKYHHSYITSDRAFSATSSNDNEWVLDGGSTRHYTGSKGLLTGIRKLQQTRTTITGNGTSPYNLVGDAVVEVSGKTIQLKDVAYIPGFNANLISVSKMVDGGAIVTYGKEKAIVTHNNTVSFTIPRIDDLYVITDKKKKEQ